MSQKMGNYLTVEMGWLKVLGKETEHSFGRSILLLFCKYL